MKDDGTSPLPTAKGETMRDRLFMGISRCDIAPLREELQAFFLKNDSVAAEHTVSHFTQASHRNLKNVSREKWREDINDWYRRTRENLFPLDGREMTDDD